MPVEPGNPDPNPLEDTVADEVVSDAEPAPSRSPALPSEEAPPHRAPERGASHDELAETVVEAPGLLEDRGGRRRLDVDVDLTRIFDRLNAEEAPGPRYDPEAGRGNVAVKIHAATEAMAVAVKDVARGAITTPFGRLVLSLFVGLAGLALTIGAITIQDRWMIVGAAIVMPVALVLVYLRYQAWLGHKRYMYRLLETLGEDVSGFDPSKRFRRTGTPVVSKKRT